jgi:plastocyanin
MTANMTATKPAPDLIRAGVRVSAKVGLRHLCGALVCLLAATHARADVVQIKMEKLGFIPAQVTAHVGDTIEWINADFVAHTATARDGAWDVLIPVNASKSVVLKAPGEVEYYCKFHPNMTGQISVSK